MLLFFELPAISSRHTGKAAALSLVSVFGLVLRSYDLFYWFCVSCILTEGFNLPFSPIFQDICWVYSRNT